MSEERSLALAGKYNPEQVALIKRTVAKGATDDELKLFIHNAQRAGLDPLLGQAMFIKRKSKNRDTGEYEEHGQTLFGRDSYRIIADRTGQMDGSETDPEFDDKGALVSATATVWRKDRSHPYRAKVYLREYIDTQRSYLWNTKPITMLCKVAEAQALRMAFPDLLTGSYVPEEFGTDEAQIVEGEIVEKQANPAPHWSVNEIARKRFHARWHEITDSLGLSIIGYDLLKAEALKVDSITSWTGTEDEAIAKIRAYCESKAAELGTQKTV